MGSSCGIPRWAVVPAGPSSAVPQLPGLKEAAVLAQCDAESQAQEPAQLGVSASALPAPPAVTL